MSVINTNVKALVATESMRSNNLKLSTAMERLSTGLRINGAKDDAAGLAISNRMTAQIRGMSMAIKNANDGISMAQTADGAYGQVNSMLQRMRELAVQSANGAVSNSDRASIQLEIDELKSEINNVADRTNFNGIKLLDGTARDVKLQTGTNEGELMSVGFSSVKAKDIGSGEAPALTSVGGLVADRAALVAGDLIVNGVEVGATLDADDVASSANANASAISKAAAINRVSEQSGVLAKVNDTVVLGSDMSGTAASASNLGKVSINGFKTDLITLTVDKEVNRSLIVNAVNTMSSQTGVTAINTSDDKQGIRLVAADGRNVVVSFSDTGGTFSAASTGVTDGTRVGTYSLYSNTGSPITIEHSTANVSTDKSSGLRIGTFEAGSATVVSSERAASGAGVGATDSTAGRLAGDTLVINGINIAAAVATDDSASYGPVADQKAASAIAIAAAINKRSAEHGVTAKAEANVLRGSALSFTGTAGDEGSVYINGVIITEVALGSRDGVVSRLNEFSDRTGVVASAYGAGIELRAADGRNINLGLATVTAAQLGLDGVSAGNAATTAQAITNFASVSLSSDTAFSVTRGNQTGTNFELLGFREGTFGGKDTGMKVAEVNVNTQLGAGMAITAIDAAIDDVASAQARSGAFQNRLDASISVLSESSENASAARSRILDTDYASETTALAKAQIVQQAATAMLAQANQQQQSVLALLQ